MYVIELVMLVDHLQILQREPCKNPRASSGRNGVPNVFMLSCVLSKSINCHLYKIKSRYKLQTGDPQRRLVFCNWLLNRSQRFLREVVIVDEANFTIRGSTVSAIEMSVSTLLKETFPMSIPQLVSMTDLMKLQ